MGETGTGNQEVKDQTPPTGTQGMILSKGSGAPILSRVVSHGETKAAVIAILSRMPDDSEATSRMSLYMLRALDDPTIIEADIAELDAKEAAAKALKKKKDEIWNKFWVLIGLALTSVLSTLIGNAL